MFKWKSTVFCSLIKFLHSDQSTVYKWYSSVLNAGLTQYLETVEYLVDDWTKVFADSAEDHQGLLSTSLKYVKISDILPQHFMMCLPPY